MIEQTEPHTEAPAKKRQYRRRAKPRQARRDAPERERAPDEFAGMTATECCDACHENVAAAEAAQRRLNELEMMYPRRPAPRRIDPRTGWQVGGETVMENDEEYLARNPQIADEFRRLGVAVLGKCQISGAPGCAHPHKAGLSAALKRDPKAVARYGRAKKKLQRQLIDLRDV